MSAAEVRLGAVLAAAALSAAISLAASLPAAGDDRAKSKVKITKLRPHVAKGKVISGDPRCKRGRKISLFRYTGFISDKVAITRSRRDGTWRVRRALQPGRYFAKADRKRGCRYDVSPARTLDPAPLTSGAT